MRTTVPIVILLALLPLVAVGDDAELKKQVDNAQLVVLGTYTGRSPMGISGGAGWIHVKLTLKGHLDFGPRLFLIAPKGKGKFKAWAEGKTGLFCLKRSPVVVQGNEVGWTATDEAHCQPASKFAAAMTHLGLYPGGKPPAGTTPQTDLDEVVLTADKATVKLGETITFTLTVHARKGDLTAYNNARGIHETLKIVPIGTPAKLTDLAWPEYGIGNPRKTKVTQAKPYKLTFKARLGRRGKGFMLRSTKGKWIKLGPAGDYLVGGSYYSEDGIVACGRGMQLARPLRITVKAK